MDKIKVLCFVDNTDNVKEIICVIKDDSDIENVIIDQISRVFKSFKRESSSEFKRCVESLVKCSPYTWKEYDFFIEKVQLC